MRGGQAAGGLLRAPRSAWLGRRSRRWSTLLANSGLLVICDAKRGDIDVTARAYGQAFFGETPTPFGAVPGLGADALTVNPLLGRDSVLPLLTAARASGRRACSCSCGPRIRAQPTSRSASWPTAARSASAWPRWSSELGGDGVGSGGHLRRRRGHRGHGAGAAGGAARARCPAHRSCSPGSARREARCRTWRLPSRPGPAGGLVSSSRGIVHAYEQVRPATRRGRCGPRQRGCASWPGALLAECISNPRLSAGRSGDPAWVWRARRRRQRTSGGSPRLACMIARCDGGQKRAFPGADRPRRGGRSGLSDRPRQPRRRNHTTVTHSTPVRQRHAQASAPARDAQVLRRQGRRHAQRDLGQDPRPDRSASPTLNPGISPNSLQTGQRLRLRR